MVIFNSWHLPVLIVGESHFQKNVTLESWNSWLLSNLTRLLNWKEPGNLTPVLLFCRWRLVKNTKNWLSWEWNITFLRINLCVRWHFLRSCFVAEVNLKTNKSVIVKRYSLSVFRNYYTGFHNFQNSEATEP